MSLSARSAYSLVAAKIKKPTKNEKAIAVENGRGRTKSAFHTTESKPQKAPNKAFCGVNTDSDSQGVLLQTAFVTAMNPQYPSQKVNLILIPDSGSQRSDVSTRVRNTLELPTNKEGRYYYQNIWGR